MIKQTHVFYRFIAAMLALLSLAAPVAAGETDPSLRSALDAYVSGLRTGSVVDLQRLFMPTGQFCSLSEDASANVTCRTFEDVLDDWAAAPDPSASGHIIDSHMTHPSMAAVIYELHFGGVQYTGQLLLYRTADGWRVVAKTTKAS